MTELIQNEREPADSPAALARHAYIAAIRLLGYRDHSVFELTQKLSKREHSTEAIETAIAELIDLNYVNDARYAELYTEQRLARGFGPLSVRNKLRQRGLASHLVDAALAAQSISWAELAQAALEKRFAPEVIISREKNDVGRMSRFLATRGFSSGDALRALNTARKELKNG